MTLGEIKNLLKQKIREVSVGTGTFDIKDADLNSLINTTTQEIANVIDEEYLRPLQKYIFNQNIELTINFNKPSDISLPQFMTVPLPTDFLKTNSKINIIYKLDSNPTDTIRICYYIPKDKLISLPSEFIFNVNYYSFDQSNFIFDRKITYEIYMVEPDGARSNFYMNYYYISKPTEMVNDTDSFPLDDGLIPLVVNGAAKDLFMRYELPNEAAQCLNEYNTLLNYYIKGKQNAGE